MSSTAERALLAAALGLVLIWDVALADLNELDPLRFAIGLAAFAGLGLVAVDRAPGWLVLCIVTAAGVALRFHSPAVAGSDVVTATTEALGVLAQGQNPYAHHYATTSPPGSPFVYPPGELALYGIQKAIFASLAEHDRWWGILSVLAVAGLAPLCGAAVAAIATAFYGSYELAVLRAVDGSNDTGLAFLMVVALVALAYGTRATGDGKARRAFILHVVSAVFLGWALAFKALAWFAFPFLVRFVPDRLRVRYAAVALGTAVAFCLPFFATAPAPFVTSILAGFTFHQEPWGFNVWAALSTMLPSAIAAAQPWMLPVSIALVLLTGAVIWTRRPQTLGAAILQGAVTLGAALLFARWSTSSYFAYLAALLGAALATLSVRR